jgi:hypothetical protein
VDDETSLWKGKEKAGENQIVNRGIRMLSLESEKKISADPRESVEERSSWLSAKPVSFLQPCSQLL